MRRFIKKRKSSIATVNLLAQKIWYNDFFYICYHAGGSTKHLPRPKVKRRDEESSPCDALTPNKRKSGFAVKMRTYLWACPLTPTPQPHLPSPCLCKIKMCGSSKRAWIVAISTTRYPLILMLCCNIFIFLVKQEDLRDEDLEWLSHKLEEWKPLGRRLKIEEATLTEFDDDCGKKREKIYKMLLHWKQANGAAATYMVLHDALCHPLVDRKGLAEQYCCQPHEWPFILLTHR